MPSPEAKGLDVDPRCIKCGFPAPNRTSRVSCVTLVPVSQKLNLPKIVPRFERQTLLIALLAANNSPAEQVALCQRWDGRLFGVRHRRGIRRHSFKFNFFSDSRDRVAYLFDYPLNHSWKVPIAFSRREPDQDQTNQSYCELACLAQRMSGLQERLHFEKTSSKEKTARRFFRAVERTF
jgi:hypothetical protein